MREAAASLARPSPAQPHGPPRAESHGRGSQEQAGQGRNEEREHHAGEATKELGQPFLAPAIREEHETYAAHQEFDEYPPGIDGH